MVASRVVSPTEPDLTLPPEEGRALFEREAQRLLGMSGEEFLRRWDAGEYRDQPETPELRNVMRVAFLISFARSQP